MQHSNNLHSVIQFHPDAGPDQRIDIQKLNCRGSCDVITGLVLLGDTIENIKRIIFPVRYFFNFIHFFFRFY